jgi:hypothetical protein
MDEEQLVMIAKAIAAAIAAYQTVIHEEGYDPAYFTLDLFVKHRTSDFETVLQTLEYKDLA